MGTDTPKILVVDDDADIRRLLALRLESAGFMVHPAADAAAAIELLRTTHCDLVVCDVVMPGDDGFELLRQIRAQYSLATLPVIMLTVRDTSEDIVRALDLGANDYVAKPVDFPVLIARVRTHLGVQRLVQQNEELMEMLSHDLRHPLALAVDVTNVAREQLAHNPDTPSAILDACELVGSAANRMQKLIHDFLDAQVVSDGQINLLRSPLDINQVTSDAVHQWMIYAQRKAIDLSFQPQAELPMVSADRTRIEQVLQNLIDNALKFSPANSTTEVATHTDNGSVVISVSDEGPGISDQDRQNLFVRHARLTNRPTSGESSTGLGLAICKEFVGLHGGEIGVQNNQRGGSTFWFSLPVRH